MCASCVICAVFDFVLLQFNTILLFYRNQCINCNVQLGEYHCEICNLWMESGENPYHCHDCGICRVGGINNFKHCRTCGMCIDKNMFDQHNCEAGKFMAKCPICCEDLFSSRTACHELPCNHSIHWHCFYEYSNVDIRCPICKKTMIQDEDRQYIWEGLQQDIDEQPLPPEETRVVKVFCNDCESTDSHRRWHPLGVHCSQCKSFNTTFDIKMKGIEAHLFLNQLEEKRRSSRRIDDKS